MFNLISGLTKAAVKTTVGLPASLIADCFTLGGEITNKEGGSCYSKDMLDSIGKDLEEMSK